MSGIPVYVFTSWFNTLKELDWLDICLHVLAGILGVGFATEAGLLTVTQALIVNVAVWFFREMWQSWRRGKTINPLAWSQQKTLEWVAPGIAVLLVVLLY